MLSEKIRSTFEVEKHVLYEYFLLNILKVDS